MEFDCGHTCPDVCHDNVRDKDAEVTKIPSSENIPLHWKEY